MATQVRANDDLTAIRGIGPSRQRWLEQEFGARSYAQLAALSPADIEARLRATGKLSSRAEIEGWVAAAARLEAALTAPQAEQEWTPAATFVIEFQQHSGSVVRPAWRTVVHHLEADCGWTWPDVEIDDVCRWLGEQAAIPQPVRPVLEQAPAPVALRATQVRVSQSPGYSVALDVTRPTPPLLGHVRHEAPISFEVELEPADDGPRSPVAPGYTARFQLHNLSRGDKPAWLDMQPSGAAGAATYRARLSDLQLAPGLYGLSILISQAGSPGAIHLRLPKLNVL